MACEKTNVRIIHKQTNTTGKVATVPATATHTDGSWLDTDLYEGELYMNRADKIIQTRLGNEIITLGKDKGISEIQTKKFFFTSDDLKYNMPIAAGIQVPTGCVLNIILAYAWLQFETTPYDLSSNTLRLKYVGDSDSDYTHTCPIDFFGSTDDKVVRMNLNASNNIYRIETDVEFFINDFSLVDGDSPVTVILFYNFLSL
jgi:hypothetical protein